MRELRIQGEVIRLGQLLKLAGVSASGADAKELISAAGVTVNGEPELRRGRKLRRGDRVAADGHEIEIV